MSADERNHRQAPKGAGRHVPDMALADQREVSSAAATAKAALDQVPSGRIGITVVVDVAGAHHALGLGVGPDDRIGWLRDLLADFAGVPPERLGMFRDGVALADDRTVGAYGLSPGDVIHCALL